jgi:hypothetical protein
MANQLMRERWAKTFADLEEKEAFARLLYSSCGGFVDWDLLPEEGQTKADYRSKAADLIELLDHFRERQGRVTAPVKPTREMVEAGYRAMLAAVSQAPARGSFFRAEGSSEAA